MDGNLVVNCDFNNPELRCHRCGFKAGAANWQNNCPLSSDDPLPGSELVGICDSLDVKPTSGCECYRKSSDMNKWGIAGCLERQAEIIRWIRKAYAGVDWITAIKAAGLSVATGLAVKLNPLDPAPGLFAECIRRAKAKADRPPAEQTT